MNGSLPPSDLRETAGFVGSLLKQIRLVWRLWNDRRVSAWVKLIPVAGLLYLLSPIDLLPDLTLPGLGEVDDVVLLLLSLKMLVDFSPPAVVREHMEALLGKHRGERSSGDDASDSYIDVPYRVLDPAEKPAGQPREEQEKRGMG